MVMPSIRNGIMFDFYPGLPHMYKVMGVHSSRGLGGGEACTKFMTDSVDSWAGALSTDSMDSWAVAPSTESVDFSLS